MIHQVSVFLENRPGQLSEITRIVSEAGVDIRALNIAETADYGILRMIVNSTQKTRQALEDNGYIASVSDVFVIEVPDRPGGLGEVLNLISEQGMDIEYMYSIFSGMKGMAYMVMKIREQEDCVRMLEEKGVRLAVAEELGLH